MASFSEMLGDLLPTSKVTHAMGAEKELPARIGNTSRRFGSPVYSLILLTIIGVIFVIFVPIRSLIPLASAFTIIWYLATHYAALKLPREKRLLPYALTWIGITACLALFFSLPIWSIADCLAMLGLLTLIRWVVRKARFVKPGAAVPPNS